MTAEIKLPIDFGGLGELRSLDTVTQAIKYAIVGVSNTLIDAAAYYALTRWLWLESLPVLAKGIAYAIGMVNSFYWNRNWTFRCAGATCCAPAENHPTNSTGRAALLFTLTHIVALGINAGVMALSLNALHTPETLALIFATAAAFGWNFFLNKWVVFK